MQFENLPRECIDDVLLFKLEKKDTIRIADEVKNELLDTNYIFFLFEGIIKAIEKAGELKLTAKGNLPPKLCKELLEELKEKGFVDEGLWQNKVNREDDWGTLQAAHICLELSGLIKKRNNKYSFTKSGKNVVNNRNILYSKFNKNLFAKYNWAYTDGYPQELGNWGAGYLIYLFHKYGKTSQTFDFYFEKYFNLNPQVLEYFDDSDSRTPKDRLKICLEIRFFVRVFFKCGLLTFDKKERYSGTLENIKTTPLFDATFTFHFDEKRKPHKSMHDIGSPMRNMWKMFDKMTEDQNFGSIEEMNEFLNQNFTGKTPEEIATKFNITENDADKAEKLIGQAYETSDEKEREKLIEKANKLSPNHPEYFLFKARKTMVKEEALKWLQKSMEASKEKIGEEFEELKGHFWGVHSTRPYMTAKGELADTLIHMKFYDEAINHFEEMLEWNPNDNQGIRYVLAPLYLLQKEYSELNDLFKEFDENSSTFAYSKAFMSFLKFGKSLKSNGDIKKAFKTNVHFPKILFDITPFKNEMSDYYSPGDESEGHWMFRNFFPFLNSKNGEKIGKWLASEFHKFYEKKR